MAIRVLLAASTEQLFFCVRLVASINEFQNQSMDSAGRCALLCLKFAKIEVLNNLNRVVCTRTLSESLGERLSSAFPGF
jgi:hypothetical protein